MFKSSRAAGLTARSSGDSVGSGRTKVYSAFLTSRGPSLSFGALCDSAGVGKAGSGGREVVKIFDFGSSRRVYFFEVEAVAAPLAETPEDAS